MSATRNTEDLFDLTTDYGKYLTVHAVVKHFGDPFEIQRLFVTRDQGAAADADDATNTAEDQTRLWHNELESIVQNQRFVLRAATEDEISKQSVLEGYFDNQKFQRLQYSEACTALNILDHARP